ncbi:conserved hypothetical protein [Leptospira interrogans serovar Manilae]|uniref:Uncharacterized protein n=1 Tax=Leptospira interrogans serovar Manilae TaxID=214675 RepID=A0AAQ1NY63_LEPIR|nr:conserved hypothetical protein [Leptospira interrogans serovar Manilae]
MWELREFNDLELLENSQIAKCNLIYRNDCILLKISKKLSCKIF